MKIAEAITILRTIDKEIDGVLANFEEPGKIDLIQLYGTELYVQYADGEIWIHDRQKPHNIQT